MGGKVGKKVRRGEVIVALVLGDFVGGEGGQTSCLTRVDLG